VQRRAAGSLGRGQAELDAREAADRGGRVCDGARRRDHAIEAGGRGGVDGVAIDEQRVDQARRGHARKAAVGLDPHAVVERADDEAVVQLGEGGDVDRYIGRAPAAVSGLASGAAGETADQRRAIDAGRRAAVDPPRTARVDRETHIGEVRPREELRLRVVPDARALFDDPDERLKAIRLAQARIAQARPYLFLWDDRIPVALSAQVTTLDGPIDLNTPMYLANIERWYLKK